MFSTCSCRLAHCCVSFMSLKYDVGIDLSSSCRRDVSRIIIWILFLVPDGLWYVIIQKVLTFLQQVWVFYILQLLAQLKLFSELYLVVFLDTSAKPCIYKNTYIRIFICTLKDVSVMLKNKEYIRFLRRVRSPSSIWRNNDCSFLDAREHNSIIRFVDPLACTYCAFR